MSEALSCAPFYRLSLLLDAFNGRSTPIGTDGRRDVTVMEKYGMLEALH